MKGDAPSPYGVRRRSPSSSTPPSDLDGIGSTCRARSHCGHRHPPDRAHPSVHTGWRRVSPPDAHRSTDGARPSARQRATRATPCRRKISPDDPSAPAEELRTHPTDMKPTWLPNNLGANSVLRPHWFAGFVVGAVGCEATFVRTTVWGCGGRACAGTRTDRPGGAEAAADRAPGQHQLSAVTARDDAAGFGRRKPGNGDRAIGTSR